MSKIIYNQSIRGNGSADSSVAESVKDFNYPNSSNISNLLDLKLFNTTQQVQFIENFYDTTLNESYIDQLQDLTNTSQEIIKYKLIEKLKDWTKTTEIVIQFPIEVRCSRPQAVWPQEYTNLASLAQGEYCFLDFIYALFIKGGSNHQDLTRSNSNFIDGIKFWVGENRLDKNYEEFLNQYGFASNKNVYVNPRFKQEFNNNHEYLGSKTIACTNTIFNDVLNTGVLVGPIPNPVIPDSTYYYNTKTINLTLPLCLVCNFFKIPSYLPPDFKLEIVSELYGKERVIACSPTFYEGAAFDNARLQVSVIPKGSPKLIYISSSLEMSYNRFLIEERLRKKFIYNYETVEKFLVDSSLGPHFEVDIAISQQRPTQLFIYTIAKQTKNTTPLFQTQRTPFHFFGQSMCCRHKSTENVTIAGYKELFNLDIENIQVVFNGRTQYFIRNEDNRAVSSYGNRVLSGYDYLLKKMEKQSYLHENDLGMKESGQSFGIPFNFRGVNSKMCITIMPGGYTDNGIISANQNSVMCKLLIRMTAQLDENIQLIVLKKLPEQIALDIENNVTLVMWPSIASGGRYLISNTNNVQ